MFHHLVNVACLQLCVYSYVQLQLSEPIITLSSAYQVRIQPNIQKGTSSRNVSTTQGRSLQKKWQSVTWTRGSKNVILKLTYFLMNSFTSGFHLIFLFVFNVQTSQSQHKICLDDENFLFQFGALYCGLELGAALFGSFYLHL